MKIKSSASVSLPDGTGDTGDSELTRSRSSASKDGARKAVLASSNRRMAAGTLGCHGAAMERFKEHQLGLFDDCNRMVQDGGSGF